MTKSRITIDTMPGEIVMAFYEGEDEPLDEVFRSAFKPDAWSRFVQLVISAAPFGVPPAL